MTRRTLVAAILGLGLFTLPTWADDLGGEPGKYSVTHDTMLELLMPELKTAGAPQWVKPGVRLTWYALSATIPQSYIGGLVQDPDGQWRDPTTGNRFRTEDAAGAAGHGITIVDVIAVHDDVVVVGWAMYGIEGLNGPLHLVATGSMSSPPGYLSSYWANPQITAKHAANLAGPGVLASRGPYPLDGKQYDALWTSVKSSSGQTSSITDLGTGIVLHTGMAAAVAPSAVNLNGVSTNVGGQTSLSQATYRGSRELQVPWAGAPMPQCLANVHRLVYTGTHTMGGIPGTPAISWRCRLANEITGVGKDFLQGARTMTIDYTTTGMPPAVSKGDFVSASTQFTPLAIPPEHLARLQTGQVLDKDPITNLITYVNFAGRDNQGRDIVVISNGQPGQGLARGDCIYDRATGLMIGTALFDPGQHTISQAFLTEKN